MEIAPKYTGPENTYGKRIRRVRQAAGMTQRDFAKVIEIHHQTIYKAEAERARFSFRLVVRLARFLDCNAYHLLAYLEGDREQIPEFLSMAAPEQKSDTPTA